MYYGLGAANTPPGNGLVPWFAQHSSAILASHRSSFKKHEGYRQNILSNTFQKVFSVNRPNVVVDMFLEYLSRPRIMASSRFPDQICILLQPNCKTTRANIEDDLWTPVDPSGSCQCTTGIGGVIICQRMFIAIVQTFKIRSVKFPGSSCGFGTKIRPAVSCKR